MRRASISMVSILVISVAFSQEIKGIILDKETNEPIAFAHVVVGDVVSLSNLDGEFILSISDVSSNDLQISYMGYEPFRLSASVIKEYNTIYLKSSIVQLEDVIVQTGDALIKKACDRFHLNYEVSAHKMTGFYKETLSNSDSLFYLAEGILNIYVASNVSKLESLVEPVRTRKKVFKELDNKAILLKGNASDMSKSSVWREDSFLNEKNRKNYDFFYSGVSKMNGQEVLLVDFEPKNSKGYITGKIFLDEKSLAILKVEYQPKAPDQNGWKNVTWTEEFIKKNGVYELFRVSYEGQWKQKEEEYNYGALLVINDSILDFEIPEDHHLLGNNDTFFQEAEENFSNTFWKGFNYIKLDLESSTFLNKQGVSTNL